MLIRKAFRGLEASHMIHPVKVYFLDPYDYKLLDTSKIVVRRVCRQNKIPKII